MIDWKESKKQNVINQSMLSFMTILAENVCVCFLMCMINWHPRDYASPKFSGDFMFPSRRFRATFEQTERQQTACSSRPHLLCKACFPVITLFTFGFIVA